MVSYHSSCHVDGRRKVEQIRTSRPTFSQEYCTAPYQTSARSRLVESSSLECCAISSFFYKYGNILKSANFTHCAILS